MYSDEIIQRLGFVGPPRFEMKDFSGRLFSSLLALNLDIISSKSASVFFGRESKSGGGVAKSGAERLRAIDASGARNGFFC
ncbi:MAG: hypothetical protein ACLR5G_03920 [Eubacteriales bacterium]